MVRQPTNSYSVNFGCKCFICSICAIAYCLIPLTFYLPYSNFSCTLYWICRFQYLAINDSLNCWYVMQLSGTIMYHFLPNSLKCWLINLSFPCCWGHSQLYPFFGGNLLKNPLGFPFFIQQIRICTGCQWCWVQHCWFCPLVSFCLQSVHFTSHTLPYVAYFAFMIHT